MIDQRGAASSEPLPAFRSKMDAIRATYGFEDVSLAPGTSTVEPSDVELAQTFCGIDLAIPVLASAMDAVVDPSFAGALAALGGLAILNLEGVQTRYDDPAAVIELIATAPDNEVQGVLSEAYAAPIREELVAQRLEEIQAAGSRAAVSATPGAARTWGPFCAEHGADLFLVQSQVSSARHLASGYDPLSLEEFTRFMPIPVAVGNTTSAEAAFLLMDQGAAGADVVMLGSPLARAEEAPGRGVNWGMAAPSPVLPRGTRIKVGTVGSLEKILFGPATVTDGSQNLMGALRQSMAALGARTIREMQGVEIVYAPAVVSEGKSWQQGR